MPRSNGRTPDEARPCRFEPGFISTADGSCLATSGQTRVICTASVESGVPPWLLGQGRGWLTAEYSMLPGSTGRRKPREGRRGFGVDGRTAEIQRLIGRALRQAVDQEALGERTIHLDCDVIEADGGTRTTAINGAFLALDLALTGLVKKGVCPRKPLIQEVGAISVGLVEGELLLDLDYKEDARAQADLNLVMTAQGELIEIQGTAEKKPFTRNQLTKALDLAQQGISRILAVRRAAESG